MPSTNLLIVPWIDNTLSFAQRASLSSQEWWIQGLIAAQNAVTAAESLEIGSCYIGDVMEHAEEMKQLLKLPQYVYPACMLVFGYATEQQKEREKPERFSLSDIVCENTYQSKNSEQIRAMFAKSTGTKTYDDWMEAFWKRKYESDFSKEMNRSMEVYLKDFE